ncbi:MAG: BrnA antitoxin family protein [Selenomonas sp.]|nr:BrnA antitoxin family protein [Selenomonas sp.]
MAIRKMVVRPGQKPTEEQRKRIRRAASLPITYDEDCPELTEEQYEMFARIAAKQRAGRKKRLVSIRVSPDTLEKAKKLGKGYTGVLSRLLDLAINDPEMVAKCL